MIVRDSLLDAVMRLEHGPGRSGEGIRLDPTPGYGVRGIGVWIGVTYTVTTHLVPQGAHSCLLIVSAHPGPALHGRFADLRASRARRRARRALRRLVIAAGEQAAQADQQPRRASPSG